MLKVVNCQLHRLGQSFLDEVWPEEDEGRISPGGDSPTGRISPHGPQGVINEENYSKYEPTTIEEPVENQPTLYQRDAPPGYQQEISTQNEQLGIPEEAPEIEYDGSIDPNTGQSLDQQKQVYDGIDNNEVISFDYTNRFGQYAGTRIVEPHYTFQARTTGNEVLVTFDRTKNDIRAFIVGNIHPFGVRYENVLFEPRGEIMRGIN